MTEGPYVTGDVSGQRRPEKIFSLPNGSGRLVGIIMEKKSKIAAKSEKFCDFVHMYVRNLQKLISMQCICLAATAQSHIAD